MDVRNSFFTKNVDAASACIYLDNAASTPLDPEVYAAMAPWMFSFYGNPAARLHPLGELSEEVLAAARLASSRILGLAFEEIIFTSSATESNNLVLRGLVESPFRKRKKIVFGATEHSSIATTALALQEHFGKTHGIVVEILPVDSHGQVDLKRASQIIDDNTLCVCLMDVNNETGVVQGQLSQIIDLSHAQGALVHIDAVQGFARGSFESAQLDYDTLTLSSGKIYGPKGAALLAVRKRSPKIRIEPQLTGGGHEANMRSSTPNVPAIVGFVEAMTKQSLHRDARNSHLKILETAFLNELDRHIKARVFALDAHRVPGIFMVCFPGVNAMKLIENTKNVALSAGSACRTLQATASHVLVSMGVELEDALASFRVSMGQYNTVEQVRDAARHLAKTASSFS